MPAHYLIFHPENQRQVQRVTATSMINNKIVPNWNGHIYVDRIRVGNEDPFVFNNPWIYSFCHATQLKKKINHSKSYVQKGSWLLFVSCQYANMGVLTFDTLFLVEGICQWFQKPFLQLPLNYQYLNKQRINQLWRRHFKYPFQGQHSNVKFTYEAKLWQTNEKNYSFLPYNSDGERVSFPISQLAPTIANKINSKLYGKRPVELDNSDISQILIIIDQLTSLKVLRDIK